MKPARNTWKYLVSAAAAVLLLLCAQSAVAFAATPQADASSAVVVANVNVRNAKLSMNGNVATISFSLDNGIGAQPDIRYGILAAPASTNSSESDEYIASETVSLSENQSVERTITYTPPPFLSGPYTLVVEAKTSAGMPLGVAIAGNATFTASTQNFADILFPSCYLTVAQDATSTKYVPQQGVDVRPTETLSAHCDVQSHFNVAQSLAPHIETHYRTEFGDTVSAEPSDAASVMFAAGEKKTALTFSLPLPKSPQSYEALVSLRDASGARISNIVMLHYVLDGASATIQNVVLDKDHYAKGDTALASLTWTPSADSFPNSRHGSSIASGDSLSLELSLSDGFGQKCANNVTQKIDPLGSAFGVSIPVLSACSNPSIGVFLRGKNGALLASKTFSIVTAPPPPTPVASANLPFWLWPVIGGAILLVIILGIAVYVWTRKRGTRTIPGQYQTHL